MSDVTSDTMDTATDKWGPPMSELDNGYPPTNSGGTEGAGEVGPLPFFPAPPGPATGPRPAMPLSAPIPPAPAAGQTPPGRHTQTAEQQATAAIPSQGPAPAADPAMPPPQSAPPAEPASRGAVVKGRIKVEDEVIEKIAALAALEVQGIAGLGVDMQGAIESTRGRAPAGQRRGDQGVQAKVQDNEVSLDVTVVVEYGSIVMEVAKAVKSNVARVTSRMLGMRVTSVNITVHDVHIPDQSGSGAAARQPGPEAGERA